jgi:hypothetical protein
LDQGRVCHTFCLRLILNFDWKKNRNNFELEDQSYMSAYWDRV